MSDRLRRVNETLKKVVSEGIGELKDPGIGFVTVTGVEATEDVREATVYVSVYGSEKDRRATLEALRRAHGVLQAKVNRELHLRADAAAHVRLRRVRRAWRQNVQADR